MKLRIPLKKVIDGIEDCDMDGVHGYLNVKTGEVSIYMEDATEEELAIPEGIDEDPDYLALPDKFDIHEWEIMRRFSEGVEDDAVRDDLLNAIRGSGAFRYFKDTIHRHGIEKDWYKHRDEAIREIAIDWCRGNDIEYL